MQQGRWRHEGTVLEYIEASLTTMLFQACLKKNLDLSLR